MYLFKYYIDGFLCVVYFVVLDYELVLNFLGLSLNCKLVGLEKMNPFAIMMSNRWWKLPASIMFKELFKYISGVNQVSRISCPG